MRASIIESELLQSFRESESRFREMIDALPVAIYTTDAQGRLTHFNRAAVEFSGRVPELGTDQWCVSWKLYRSDGTPMAHDECPMAIALKEGREVRGVEAIAERPDGQRIWFTPYPTPLLDAQGKVVGGINMLLDITDRKHAEQASARLAAIVRSSDDAIISKDLDGIITSWNEGAERLFGYTADEVIGRPVAILIPPNRLGEEPQILERLRRGERVDHFETVRMRKDGSLLDISLTISPVKDSRGRIVGASKVARDISDRKRAEEALRGKEAQLEAELDDTKMLQGISAEMIHHNNVKTLYEKIMDAAVAIMRSDFASMQMLFPERGSGGELCLLAFRGFNPQAAKFWEWVRADSESTCGVALRTGKRAIAPDVEKCDYMAGTQDLATYLQTGIHSVQTTPLFSRSGKMVGMISTHWRKPHEPSERDLRLLDILARQAADLLERSETAAALHDAHAQLANRALNLEKLVQERTTKLRETISELESFSYSITHDMRAPLRAMQSFAAMLAEECTQLSAQGHDYARRIVASASRMDQLITDVLNYSRVAHADLPLKTVDTARLLREILESYPTFQPPQAVISSEERLPPVLGNEAALTQCISNLLGNAVKFVPAGTQPRVRIFFSQDDSHVHLSFQDNGIGIDPDAQKRIFQLFQRHDRKYEGTGLGLAIVKKGVERMGGSVTLTSESGQGSTFCLHLRRADSR
jgi:PAS domain S-box-containing protein